MPITIIGFDSAWTDKTKKPGAIAAITVKNGIVIDEMEARPATFSDALDLAVHWQKQSRITLVAIDQPLVVKNLSGSRPVEKAAASVVSWIKGGVQPSHRGKTGMFCDLAPIWRFLDALGANLDPVISREAPKGIHAIEVFPALALPALSNAFCGIGRHPKYNPANRTKFRLADWKSVAETITELLARAGAKALSQQAATLGALEKPRKGDQDKIDALICTLIGMIFRLETTKQSYILGDVDTGFIVSPSHPEILARLLPACAKRGVSLNASGG